MQKVIWTWWFKGRENAPEIVSRCISSWEQRNPGWQFRCLDGRSARLYLDLSFLDLKTSSMTVEGLSAVLRIHLLHEYGGVWVDPTLFCNSPLDLWLPAAASTGFFAFSSSARDRRLESWLLAADGCSKLVSKWASRTAAYWAGRPDTSDGSWFDHLFDDLCATDGEAREAWKQVPRLSDEGPSSFQSAGLYRPASDVANLVDWSSPAFKLPRKLNQKAYKRGCLIDQLLGQITEQWQPPRATTSPAPRLVCGLKVTSENVGDHIQIFAANRLLERAGVVPTLLVDRDSEIAAASALNDLPPATPILLNGWFKKNPSEWPPHPSLKPAYLGFHVRLSRAPSLISEPALAHYRAHGPVGCRDVYTQHLLASHGVETFLSNCLTLSLPRRHEKPSQKEVFVVSRDKVILDYLPDLGHFTFLSHYTDTTDFDANMAYAAELLEIYRDRAKLIVTTLLHCALPAMALGIPVVVFYPPNGGRQHRSDRERFSSLQRMVRVYYLNEASDVDWSGRIVDVSTTKLAIVDAIQSLATKWKLPPGSRLGPIAPRTKLSPQLEKGPDALIDAQALSPTAELPAPDRDRWSNPNSYRAEWADRARLAASLVSDGTSIFEIGVGGGAFRALVQDRCPYEGADLAPLDASILALDIDREPLPPGAYDCIVALGVIEYLHAAPVAIAKMCAGGKQVLISYCCIHPGQLRDATTQRRRRGWVNDFSEAEIHALFRARGFHCVKREVLRSTAEFEQIVCMYSAVA